ncbi:MAG: DUF2946 family protein [Pseudomonadota bacterium]
MKRLLLILLLTVLPLQMSWAVAAVYCQHEQANTVKHFGHHSHDHQAQVNPADDQDSQYKVHTDCGYCHGVIQAAFLTPALPPAIPSALIYIEPHPPFFSSHIPDGPRRPDRHPVA